MADVGELIIAFCLIFIAMGFGILIFDAFVQTPYHCETMNITRISHDEMLYTYTLDKGTTVTSVNYYNLTDTLNVTVKRGILTKCVVGNVYINGVV